MKRKGDEIIFHQFILVPEELSKEGNANSISQTPCEKWKKIKHALSVYGFSLLCAKTEFAGVPSEVIVGMPFDCITLLSPKACFSELTTEFNLPFRSGEWYFGDFAPRMSRELFSDENYRAFIKLKSDEQWFAEHHGKWVGFVGGKLIAEAENGDTILNQFKVNYFGQGGFYSQVLTEEEEDERAIQIP